jgi:hypothetical protein
MDDAVRYKRDKRGKLIAVETLPSDDIEPKPKRGPKFVMTTAAQDHRLSQITNATTLHVFRSLQFLAPYGKAQGRPFALPDAAAFGFSRNKRHCALTELETCGLISVERRQGRSSLITIL